MGKAVGGLSGIPTEKKKMSASTDPVLNNGGDKQRLHRSTNPQRRGKSRGEGEKSKRILQKIQTIVKKKPKTWLFRAT